MNAVVSNKVSEICTNVAKNIKKINNSAKIEQNMEKVDGNLLLDCLAFLMEEDMKQIP
jgi:hypothetical protein